MRGKRAIRPAYYLLNIDYSFHKVFPYVFQTCDYWLVPCIYKLSVENFTHVVQKDIRLCPTCNVMNEYVK